MDNFEDLTDDCFDFIRIVAQKYGFTKTVEFLKNKVPIKTISYSRAEDNEDSYKPAKQRWRRVKVYRQVSSK